VKKRAETSGGTEVDVVVTVPAVLDVAPAAVVLVEPPPFGVVVVVVVVPSVSSNTATSRAWSSAGFRRTSDVAATGAAPSNRPTGSYVYILSRLASTTTSASVARTTP
jgi:hypothetical protein